MVSTGNEGSMGSNQDIDLFTRVNDCPDIDYITIHIWPYNWSWAREEVLTGPEPGKALEAALANTAAYVDEHLERAYDLRKPVVIEEFGFPRDGFSASIEAPTCARDTYYAYVFSQVGTCLQGANFWGWSGFAWPLHEQWESGDPYTGDPAQEAQGLNGVYVSDTTVDIIKDAINNINHNN